MLLKCLHKCFKKRCVFNICNFSSIKLIMKNCKCKKKKKHIWLKIFVAITIVVCVICAYFHFYVNPQIVSTNIAHIKANTTSIVDGAISKTLGGNTYEDLISISKDSQGKITLISVNSKNVNALNNEIISFVQTALSVSNKLFFEVSLGCFTGITALNSLGPNIKIQMTPIGSVSTKFVSKFSQAGINQTSHKIFLQITTEVCAIMPLYTQNVVVTSQVLVTESIIIGEVPDVYLNSNAINNALNLVP